MQRIAPAGDVYQAGTLSGNPLAVAAGLATLENLDARAYDRLRALTDRLATGLREAAEGPAGPGRLGPRPRHAVLRRGGAARLRRGASACNLDAYGRFARAMLDRGIYPPASQFEAWFVSLAHDAAAIERTVDAASEAFAEALVPGT